VQEAKAAAAARKAAVSSDLKLPNRPALQSGMVKGGSLAVFFLIAPTDMAMRAKFFNTANLRIYFIIRHGRCARTEGIDEDQVAVGLDQHESNGKTFLDHARE
jgi:hypothetical protein